MRHGLEAALRDCARTVRDALATFKGTAHKRMGLEALKFLERREIGIVVAERHHKPDGNEIIFVMVDE